MIMTLGNNTPSAYVLTMRVLSVLLSIFVSGCVFYLGAWITCSKN